MCLTLTSGGCNALNLCIQGAAQVVSVDCNPAQSALLELKAVAIQCAPSPPEPIPSSLSQTNLTSSPADVPSRGLHQCCCQTEGRRITAVGLPVCTKGTALNCRFSSDSAVVTTREVSRDQTACGLLMACHSAVILRGPCKIGAAHGRVPSTGRQLEFEDVWAMFGEGRHPDIARLFEHRLAPFMTQTSIQFWRKRLHYFRTGLYYQGGMVRICSLLLVP